MQIQINEVKTEPVTITLKYIDYVKLSAKAVKWDLYKEAQRERGKEVAKRLTPEQRIERSRKAAMKRWANKRKEVIQ